MEINLKYRLGIYEKAMPLELSWEQRLLAAREAGYDYLEMSIDETEMRMARLDYTDEEIYGLLDAQRKADLLIESICFSAQRRYPLGTNNEEQEKYAVNLLEKAVLLAKRLGIRMIQIQGYDCYYGEESDGRTKERFFRNLRRGVLFAAQHGVILGMETMENNFINTIEKAMYYIAEINSPYLQVYPDIGNISNATEYVCKDIRMGKGHIAAVHLKETLPGRFRDIPFGTGNVAFADAIAALYGQGIRRYVAECWNGREENWKETIKNNRDFLDRQFLKARQLLETE